MKAQTIDPTKLGSRLRLARTTARITQEKAAAQIGVARTTIVAIEAGERQVRPEELLKLAELYGVSVNQVLRSSAVHLDLVPQFRRSNSMREGNEVALEAARSLQMLAETCAELEQLLGKQRSWVRLAEYRIQKANWHEQAEDLADEMRKKLGMAFGPLGSIFVTLETEAGFRIFLKKLPSEIAGAFVYHEEVGPCILLNALHPPTRRAWTCSHELAHYLTNRNAVDVAWIQGEGKSLDERFADRFAAALLMPRSTMRLRFQEISDTEGKFSPRSLVFLARSFQVSVEAMARRLEQLNLLPAGTYDSLLDRGFSVKDADEVLGPGEVAGGEFIPYLMTLSLDALEAGYLTEAQVAEILNIDRVAVRRLADSLLLRQAGDGNA
jgi:Zn-dependent peptidase ImmA (M78 family)/DNA-binding XRE family transcriptional regulator